MAKAKSVKKRVEATLNNPQIAVKSALSLLAS